MIKTQRPADIASGLFCVVFGLVVLYAATKITGGMEERLPPRTLPYFLGGTMVITGILLTIRSWRYRGLDPAIKWPDRAGTVRVLVNLVGLALYILLIELIGMPLSTTLYVGCLVWYLGQGGHRLLYGLVTGVLSGLVVHYVFIRFLELSFPVGFLAR